MAFNLRLLFHVLGILLVISLLTYTIVFTQYYATMLTLGLVLAFQIVNLQHCISATNRLLARFLAAIKFEDYSQSFQSPRYSGGRLNASFSDLGRSMDDVMQHFRQSRSDQELQATYLKALVEQIPIGVCSINDEGKILFSNYAFNTLFGKTKLKTLEDLKRFSTELVEVLIDLTASRGRTIKITHNHEVLHLKISCTTFRTMGKHEKLISIQNIQNELETNELESWQNLIRVMTHEIMNSVTPITSLSETANDYIREAIDTIESDSRQEKSLSKTKELLEDASDANKTIGNRGQGLMRFVESYRSLTKLPTPKIQLFSLSDLFKSIENLLGQKAKQENVGLSFSVRPQTLELRADSELLEQALINLINNALEALENFKIKGNQDEENIEVVAELLELGKIRIGVKDNGMGISKENLQNVFIPFFTTKRGGSGIGMSIVRQIIKLNGGSIHIESSEEKGTSVIMSF